MLKVVISFLVGAAAGAAAALLLAPSSGEDLRHHLHDVAESDRERMRVEYQRGMDDLRSRMDKMSTDVSSALQKEDVVEEVKAVEVEASSETD